MNCERFSCEVKGHSVFWELFHLKLEIDGIFLVDSNWFNSFENDRHWISNLLILNEIEFCLGSHFSQQTSLTEHFWYDRDKRHFPVHFKEQLNFCISNTDISNTMEISRYVCGPGHFYYIRDYKKNPLCRTRKYRIPCLSRSKNLFVF